MSTITGDCTVRIQDTEPVSLCQLVMKLTAGISERKVVLSLVGILAAFGLVAIPMIIKS